MQKCRAKNNQEVTKTELENQKLAYQAAVESIVLLKNDGTLPLDSETHLALFGAGARKTVSGGSGSGEVNARHTTNILEGIESRNMTVTTKQWIDKYDELWETGRKQFIQKYKKKFLKPSTKLLAELLEAEYIYPNGDLISSSDLEMSQTDTCIYVVSRQSGEGHDCLNKPGSYQLTEVEIKNITLCAEYFDRFILVLNTSGPIDLSCLDAFKNINAILHMGQLGMEGGHALASVLTGDETPSGKLAVTWANQYEDYPFYDEYGPYAAHKDTAFYKEGIYVGYKYFDSFQKTPMFPFGFGKSYTSFSISVLDVFLKGEQVVVHAEVTNTGKKYQGKEIVQIYASCPQTSADKEVKRLVAFGKTKQLAPGDTQMLELTIPISYLTSYDEIRGETYLDSGDYIVYIGNSSRTIDAVAVLAMTDRQMISRHKNLCRSAHNISELKNSIVFNNSGEKNELIRLSIDGHLKPYVAFEYQSNREPEKLSNAVKSYLNQFSAKDMIQFCSGTGLFGEKKGFITPGSVGHTTTKYINIGIPNIEFCDGPAGLRLQRRTALTKRARFKPIDPSISLYDFLPKSIKSVVMGNEQKDTILYQFVTGFPTASSLAQTWSEDLLTEIGRAISKEMTEYGVTFWLAPALNIIKNPLCGRNYEYYSEDAIVSGKLAASITRGVQETRGHYVTIKHFAVNNQEENRYTMSAELDERTLREVYLRGFEIVVKEASPGSIMTAYNKVNGVYCPNSFELCTNILRNEWGFHGLVMTDWFATGKNRADEALCINSGVDIIMPGGKATAKKILSAYHKGTISLNNLQIASGNTLEKIIQWRDNPKLHN